MLRAAIVGLGTWGQNLVASVQGKSDLIRFSAGCDAHAGQGGAFAERSTASRCRRATRSCFRRSEIDAVVLATPHLQHAAQIMLAARAGKHVFTEKPLGIHLSRNAGRGARLCGIQGHARGRLQLALPARAAGTQAHAGDGRLGKLLHIEGNFCGPSAYRFPRATGARTATRCPRAA
jgi:predicted dehydrogenase